MLMLWSDLENGSQHSSHSRKTTQVAEKHWQSSLHSLPVSRHLQPDTDPFDGQCIKVWVTIFLYTLFMRLKNGQKLKKIKNTLKKSLIFICHTDVALISTYFVCCGCNFKWITTMPLKFFRILLTNLKKML